MGNFDKILTRSTRSYDEWGKSLRKSFTQIWPHFFCSDPNSGGGEIGLSELLTLVKYVQDPIVFLVMEWNKGFEFREREGRLVSWDVRMERERDELR